MKELKVILSPHFYAEEFVDEVSGIVFKKTTGIVAYTIDLEESKLSGIQSALRKNILLPFDRQTLDFVNGKNLVKDEIVEGIDEVNEIVEKVEVKEPEVVVEAKEEVAAPKKATRKRNVKKEETE